MKYSSLLLLPFLPLVLSLSTIYWPVTHPSKDNPWILGQKNLCAWTTGGGTGIDSFDIQLHNFNKSVMIGFVPVALRVPMEKLSSGSKNYGGEIEVDLNLNLPTGDGFFLLFMNTYHGQVYSKSPQFSIYPSTPDNFTAPDLPTATITATVTRNPNPTQEWAITLNGIDPDATGKATQIAGNAGSGT
ncbi:hypothetical protein IAU60_003237 [Kwoniella sp. DSM 27419]